MIRKVALPIAPRPRSPGPGTPRQTSDADLSRLWIRSGPDGLITQVQGRCREAPMPAADGLRIFFSPRCTGTQ
jgi:hypothetical protein